MIPPLPLGEGRGEGQFTAPARRGFTVIELTGVLAIIAVIASVLVPPVIRRIDRAMWERERSDLNTMAQGFVQSIKSLKFITNNSQFAIATAIANYRGLAVNQVSNNARGFARVFVVDPAFTISWPSGSDVALNAPYMQNNNGTIATNVSGNARMMLISILAGTNLPASGAVNFNQVWDAPEGTVPASLGNQRADDLLIQRLDLGGLFHKLVLLNVDTNGRGYYTFESNSTSFLSPGGGSVTVYLLDGTAVNLYSLTNTFQIRALLTEDRSFVYQNGRWTANLAGATIDTPSLGTFGNWVDKFLNAPAPPDPKFGAKQQAVIESFYNYMIDYVIWSQGDPPLGIPIWQGNGSGNNAPQYPYYRLIRDATTQLGDVSGNLVQ